MSYNSKWDVSKEEQEKLIKAITPVLPALRTKVGISQGQLAKILGVSRQTYSSIETESRLMSWNTFLSLVMFFDFNNETHQMIRDIGAFPEALVHSFNNSGCTPYEKTLVGVPEELVAVLDDAAFQAIRTVVMMEYARCAKMSGDAVIKAFDGVTFSGLKKNVDAEQALKSIKSRRKRK